MEAAAEAEVARRRANYEQVRTRHANGACVAQVARTVGISRMTVYKYLREGPPLRKRHSLRGRQRVLEPWKPELLTNVAYRRGRGIAVLGPVRRGRVAGTWHACRQQQRVEGPIRSPVRRSVTRAAPDRRRPVDRALDLAGW